MMSDSPRVRRLRSDYRALEKLRAESSILEFAFPAGTGGAPPELYFIRLLGRGLFRMPGSSEVFFREQHEVSIRLGAGYPRMMPEISWKTPIFHPNVSSNGIVCLGGYGTYWVPSLSLDELCIMLWDVVRYANFDVDSPYNREAAFWAKNQPAGAFPVDKRPLRDRVAGVAPRDSLRRPPIVAPPRSSLAQDAISDFSDVIDAEILEPEEPEILYIE